MPRIIVVISLFVLFLIGAVNIANTSALANDYEKKLRQVAKANRSFQLPNALILKQAILDLGMEYSIEMEYFIEKTGLIDKIADRHLKELGIYLSVDLACYDYIKYLKNNLEGNMSPPMLELPTIHEEMKPLLIDAIIRVSKEVE